MLDYYKKVIEYHKTELKKLYVTAIASLIEQDEDSLEKLGYIGDNKRITKTTIVWVDDRCHVNTNKTSVTIEFTDDDGEIYETTKTLYELDNNVLEYMYNVLSK